MRDFKRGDVFFAYIPPFDFTNSKSPPPSYILEGPRRLIMLHDSDDRDLPPRSVLVAPITQAKTASSRGNLAPSYVFLPKSEHKFLDYDSYVATHQIFPVNREWLGLKPIGRVRRDAMLDIDMAIIRSAGLEKAVHAMALNYLKQFEKEMEWSKAVSAAREKDHDKDRGLDR